MHPDGSIALELSFDNNMRAGRVLKFPWRTTLFEPVVDSVNFGEWDGYTEKVYLLQVKNNGLHDLSITSTALHGNEFRVDETLPFDLPAGETSLIKVVMYPEGSPEGSVYHDILTLNADRDSTERIAVQVHLLGHYPDITSPLVSLSPDTDTIQTNAVIQILFNESVRISDGSELTDENAGSVVVFREENENGPDVPVTLKVSEDKTSIEISPLSELDAFQHYFLKIRAELEDYSGNLFAGKEKTFTTTPSLGFETLDIYSISGQLIHSRKGISARIYSVNLSNQAPGFYLLKIEAKAHAETLYLKITKN